MRTRTLLLLAVSCGLVILIAGSVFFLRLASQTTPEPPLAVGSSGSAGDATVTVHDVDTTESALIVTVTLGGVDDADGLDGFSLVAPGKRIAPDTESAAVGACTGFTVAEVTCTLSFPTEGLTGTDRQLLLIRAEEQVRWKLV
ncbi:MAG TPA: hypothetical protein PK020_14890 [Ilumatobacteraceae bacterium]|nr:hypothetical protein [Ilumatobacteraceae bacterium]HRB04843.1 hypothetical protein [Ilumatobacteraceae bacterium]